MSLTQPEGKTLPKELDTALAQARTNLSLLEAESSRLEKIISSQKREVVVHEAELKDFEKRKELLISDLGDLETEHISARKSLDAITTEVKTKESFLTYLISEIEENESIFDERKKNLAQDELSLVKEKALFDTARAEFAKVVEAHEEKVKRIQAAIT